MKIGVTGATGFIGNIIRNGLCKEHELYSLRTDTKCFYKKLDLDVLIHCARSDRNITDDNGDLELNPSGEQWHNEFETDVMLAYAYSKKAVLHWTGLSKIIFISSIYGSVVPTVRPIPINYLVCKAAERYLSRCLAVEFAPQVDVNTIVLGGVESSRPVANQTQAFKDKYAVKTLTGCMTQPGEIVPAVKFLIEAKGITGTEIEITGGYGY